jgi:preprotein translocase subunit SecD
MSKLTRFIILLFTIVVSFVFLAPSIQWYFFLPQKDKDLLKLSQDQLDIQTFEVRKRATEIKNIRKGAISLGLDLQGGANLTMQINEGSLTNLLLEKYDFDTNKLVTDYKTEYANASDRALEVLKNRMDQFGVAEPLIRKTFEGRISVELPGLSNPQQIMEALSKAGRLEFKIVDEKAMKELEAMKVPMVPREAWIASRQDVPTNFVLPEGSEWASCWKNDEFGIPKLNGWLVLFKKVELDGSMINNARADHDQFGGNVINFTLTPEGADIFDEVTAQNVRNRLAIVLDDKVKSAPVINSEISGGSGQISGDFTIEDAVFLQNVLKAGSLPVKMDIVQQRVIGSSLGEDSINDMIKGGLIGAGFVILFMIIYYRVSGFFSLISLAFDILYVLALTASVPGTTLTLSSIAGIFLTVGIAVDANVIIYERMREELRRSRSYRHALENGFLHARPTILDSNVTTLIAGFALYAFGQGSIKGFGLTLCIGILSNIFAALFITRLIYDWILDTFKVQKISV